MITLIAAMTEDRVIGNGNDIPWHIPEDFAHFKRSTLDHPIIMGRVTWDSLPRRPLPRRDNIVVSRSPMNEQGMFHFSDVQEALDFASGRADEVFVIGGQTLYEQTIGLSDRLLLTHVKNTYEGDRYFPSFDKDDWVIDLVEDHELFKIVDYRRKRD